MDGPQPKKTDCQILLHMESGKFYVSVYINSPMASLKKTNDTREDKFCEEHSRVTLCAEKCREESEWILEIFLSEKFNGCDYIIENPSIIYYLIKPHNNIHSQLNSLRYIP